MTDDRIEPGRPSRSRFPGSARRLVVIAVMIVCLFVLARQAPIGDAADALAGWVRDWGAWGPLIFGLIYIVAVVALVPASALSIAAGAIFGPWVGTILVSIAATTGAALAFLASRYLLRGALTARFGANPRLQAIDQAIGEGGWKIVALLRLSPAVPFNIQNYLYGLTRIRFWPCTITSWLAMLPGTLLYVSTGHAGRAGLSAVSQRHPLAPLAWAPPVIGLVATVVVVWYVNRLARKALAATPSARATEAETEAGGAIGIRSRTR